jgi:hypothetical protein
VSRQLFCCRAASLENDLVLCSLPKSHSRRSSSRASQMIAFGSVLTCVYRLISAASFEIYYLQMHCCCGAGPTVSARSPQAECLLCLGSSECHANAMVAIMLLLVSQYSQSAPADSGESDSAWGAVPRETIQNRSIVGRFGRVSSLPWLPRLPTARRVFCAPPEVLARCG